MHPIFRQLKEWLFVHLAIRYTPKRVGPETQCVVYRPIIGWDVGHEHIYQLHGEERHVWEDCDPLVKSPKDIEVHIVEEVDEESWRWDWDESSDNSWAKLMYYFAAVEDPEL